MTDTTILVLQGMGIPPWSARGLTETLRPVAASAQLARDINGTMRDWGDTAFRKYALTISGSDLDPPAADMVWPGTELTVDCITELAYESMTGSPGRTAVSGSEREADGFTFYRPQLSMMVTGWSIQTDEYGAEIGWTLELEEI